MTVAYLVSQYPAASHTFIRREIEHLRRSGLRIATFSIRRPSLAECRSQNDKEECHNTTYILPPGARLLITAALCSLIRSPSRFFSVLGLALKHRPPGVRGLIFSFVYFFEATLLAAQLKQAGARHLHIHFANPAAIAGMLAAKLSELPFSLTLHGISEFDYPAGLLLSAKIEAAKFVACASWFVQAQAMRLCPASEWYKFQIVRCGLDLAHFPQRPTADRGSERALKIICVGRLSAEKGHLGLFRALSEIEAGSVELSLIGDGPLRSRLERYVNETELRARVHFLGAQPEDVTRDLIAGSDLLVLPSFMEGLPVVLMEAMALGVPVLAPRIAGIPELVADGENGYLFTPANWQDMAEKMRFLIGSRDARTSVLANARRTVQRDFDVKLSAGKLLSLFADDGRAASDNAGQLNGASL